MITYELRDVPGYPGWQADSDGKVYRDGVEVVGHVLNGYVYVGRIGKRATLVCIAFHGHRPVGKHLVAHWNDVPDDDRPENLRWATRAENQADRNRNGWNPARGQAINTARLTEGDVREIRAMYSVGTWSTTELAGIFGVGQSTVSDIVNYKTWQKVV